MAETRQQTAPEPARNDVGSTGGQIVAGVDGSSVARHALRWAVAEAIIRNAPLTAISAADGPLLSAPLGLENLARIDMADLLLAARRRLDGVVDDVLSEVPDPPPELERISSSLPAAGALVQEASSASLIVVGTRQLGGPARWIGSVSDQVVRHSPCPVAVIPESDGVAYRTDAPIVVGVDGSKNSVAALRWALTEARCRGCSVRAVTVWSLLDQNRMDESPFDPEYDEAAAQSALDRFLELELGADAEGIQSEVVCDLPVGGLLGAADRAGTSLIVVGARGIGGFRGLLLGSAAQKVLAQTHRPVVIVKA